MMRLNHHAVVVHDMDAAIGTFRDLIGWQLEFRYPPIDGSRGLAFVRDPSTSLRTELILDPGQPSGSLDHISFEVDDVSSEFERLIESGFQAVHAPFEVEMTEVADRKVHDRRGRIANLRDPNDIGIQLVRYLSPVE